MNAQAVERQELLIKQQEAMIRELRGELAASYVRTSLAKKKARSQRESMTDTHCHTRGKSSACATLPATTVDEATLESTRQWLMSKTRARNASIVLAERS